MIETTTRTTYQRSSAIRAQIALSFVAFILIGGNDGALGVLLPSLREHYSIDKATVGLLFASSTTGYLFAAFGSGLLLERLGRRVFLALGPALLMVGATLISLMPPFAGLMGAFVLIGFGLGLLDAGLNAYVAGLPNNTALLNYLHAFYGVGALLGPLLATAVLGAGLGWNRVYYVWIALSAFVMASFAIAFRGRGPLDEAEQSHIERQGNTLAAALRLRVVWLAACFLLVYVGAEVSLGGWGFTFLTEERHEDGTLSGFAMSGYWLGLTLGRLVLGKVSERIGDGRLIELCLAGTVVGVLMVWLVPAGGVMAAGLWLAGFSLGPIFPTTIAIMSSRVPARLLPSAIGFAASFGSMGVAFLPAAAGALTERVGLWALMPYVILLMVLQFALWAGLQRQQSSRIAV